MTIVQQASGLFSGASFTPTLPAASSAGNCVVLFIAGNTIVNTPTSWSARAPQVNEMGHYLFDRSGVALTSVAVTPSPAGQGTWWIAEIQGGFYQTHAGSNAAGVSNSYTTPAITPTAGTRIVIASLGQTTANATVRTLSGWTNGFIEQADLCQPSADYPMQGVAVLDNLTANGSTAYSTTGTYSASGGRSAIIASYVTTVGGATLTSAVDDPASAVDAVTGQVGRPRMVDDVMAGSDGVAAATAAARALVDPVAVVDALTITRTETAFVTGSFTLNPVAARVETLADTLTGTDQPVVSVDRVAALTDTASVVDILTGAAVRTTTVTDLVALVDTISVERAGVGSASLSDTVAATDSLTTAAARTTTVSDSLTVVDGLIVDRAGVLSTALSDPVAGTDQLTTTQVLPRTLTDAAAATDALTVERTSGAGAAVEDPLTVLDQIEAQWVRAAVIADTLPVTDTPTSGSTRTTTLTDTLTLADVLVLFAGPVRDVDLTLTVKAARYQAVLQPDRYASHVRPNRYGTRVP